MKILIDTNILVDYLSKRQPYFENAKYILTMCATEKIQGCIAAHSVMNIFYILRKEYSIDKRRIMLKQLCSFLTVIDIDNEKIISSLNNYDFDDIEDCLQTECAKAFSAEYIVTRNVKDFNNSIIPPILPDEFLDSIKEVGISYD